MNHMKEVAQMLDVELEEEFELKERYGLYKINKNGLYRMLGNEWKRDNDARLTLSLILNGRYTVKKKSKPILDDIEKEYLSNIITPFIDKITYIRKNTYLNNTEYIDIGYCESNKVEYNIEFPLFKKGAMYKGMEANKSYTLEDLGL